MRSASAVDKPGVVDVAVPTVSHSSASANAAFLRVSASRRDTSRSTLVAPIRASTTTASRAGASARHTTDAGKQPSASAMPRRAAGFSSSRSTLANATGMRATVSLSPPSLSALALSARSADSASCWMAGFGCRRHSSRVLSSRSARRRLTPTAECDRHSMKRHTAPRTYSPPRPRYSRAFSMRGTRLRTRFSVAAFRNVYGTFASAKMTSAAARHAPCRVNSSASNDSASSLSTTTSPKWRGSSGTRRASERAASSRTATSQCRSLTFRRWSMKA
mmetsp:Transcript_22263/g.78021  ORF Transcript_22263/g.78021 Transcript_22263/m.78021 type:complete len:276 (+) Transcript_22263:1171-1998(+)